MVEVNLLAAMAWMNLAAARFEAARAAPSWASRASLASAAGVATRLLHLEGGALDLPRVAAQPLLALRVNVVTVKPGFVDTAMTRGKPGLFWLISAEEAARQSLGWRRSGKTPAASSPRAGRWWPSWCACCPPSSSGDSISDGEPARLAPTRPTAEGLVATTSSAEGPVADSSSAAARNPPWRRGACHLRPFRGRCQSLGSPTHVVPDTAAASLNGDVPSGETAGGPRPAAAGLRSEVCLCLRWRPPSNPVALRTASSEQPSELAVPPEPARDFR